jgi:hypothetical protein
MWQWTKSQIMDRAKLRGREGHCSCTADARPIAKAKKLPKVVLEREIYGGATHFARCTSTQSSNDSDGVPLAVALANWFRGSHID